MARSASSTVTTASKPNAKVATAGVVAGIVGAGVAGAAVAATGTAIGGAAVPKGNAVWETTSERTASNVTRQRDAGDVPVSSINASIRRVNASTNVTASRSRPQVACSISFNMNFQAFMQNSALRQSVTNLVTQQMTAATGIPSTNINVTFASGSVIANAALTIPSTGPASNFSVTTLQGALTGNIQSLATTLATQIGTLPGITSCATLPITVNSVNVATPTTMIKTTTRMTSASNPQTVPATGTTTSQNADCRWAEWNTWSSCSTTCGVGTRIRIRNIAQQAKPGGISCVGNFNETGSCAAQDQSACASNELAGSLHLVFNASRLQPFLTGERPVRCLGEAVATLAGIPDDFVRIQLTNLNASDSSSANANAAFRILLDDANAAADFVGVPSISAFDLYTAMSRMTTSRINNTVTLACSMQGLDSVMVSGWTPPAAPLTNASRPTQARKPPIFLVGSFRFTAPSCGIVADDIARRSFRKLLVDLVNTTLKDDETPVAITVRSSQQASCELDATYGIDLRREAMERNFSGGRQINGTSVCAQVLGMTPTAVTRKVNDFLVAASSTTLVDISGLTCAGGFPYPSLYYTQTSTTTTTTTVRRVTEAPVGRQLAAVTTQTTTKLPGTTKMYFESYKIRNTAGRDSSLLFVVGVLALQQLKSFS